MEDKTLPLHKNDGETLDDIYSHRLRVMIKLISIKCAYVILKKIYIDQKETLMDVFGQLPVIFYLKIWKPKPMKRDIHKGFYGSWNL